MTTEQHTDVLDQWEVLEENGDVWSSTSGSIEDAVAQALQSLRDLYEAWDSLASEGGRPRRRHIRLTGVRRRVVTTVTTVETGELQPMPQSTETAHDRAADDSYVQDQLRRMAMNGYKW